VPSPRDPHDPHFEVDRQDNLTLLALGEQVGADFDAHVGTCDRCQAELTELSRTVRLARESTDLRADRDAPPDSLWPAIAAEVAAERPADGLRSALRRRPGRSVPGRSVPGRPGRRTRVRAALVAAVVVAAAGVGYAAGRHSSAGGPSLTARATLAQLPGGPAATGSASVLRSGEGLMLTVRTENLPLRQGYYAVWVADASLDRMVNVGVLDGDGDGSFALPAGIDVRSYDVVDISAQDFDGNAAHQQSVLRGGLTR
jgi:hypothetical protein